jgi:hypothetical protein
VNTKQKILVLSRKNDLKIYSILKKLDGSRGTNLFESLNGKTNRANDLYIELFSVSTFQKQRVSFELWIFHEPAVHVLQRSVKHTRGSQFFINHVIFNSIFSPFFAIDYDYFS